MVDYRKYSATIEEQRDLQRKAKHIAQRKIKRKLSRILGPDQYKCGYVWRKIKHLSVTWGNVLPPQIVRDFAEIMAVLRDNKTSPYWVDITKFREESQQTKNDQE